MSRILGLPISLIAVALIARATPPPSETFFPTNGQTNITLSTSPTGSVYVFRNGVLLYSPSDYSIAGSVLTMTTAASVGDVVRVLYQLGGNNGVPNMLSLYSDPNTLVPSSFVQTDETNKILTIAAKDVNSDGHPGSFVCGRITGVGLYTLNCDITPPQMGLTKFRFLDHTGTEKASLQFNDLMGTATLSGFTNPWPTANVAGLPFDNTVSVGATTLATVYSDVAQISYTAFTRIVGNVSGTMTMTFSWTEPLSGTNRTFTTPSINLQSLEDSVSGTLAVNSNGPITVLTTVTGNANNSATYHAAVKAIY